MKAIKWLAIIALFLSTLHLYWGLPIELPLTSLLVVIVSCFVFRWKDKLETLKDTTGALIFFNTIFLLFGLQRIEILVILLVIYISLSFTAEWINRHKKENDVADEVDK